MTKQQTPIGATALGFPRIGRNRELKKALDSYWAGTTSGRDLDEVATDVRLDALDSMSGAGLDSVPVNTFSWYDHVLDTAVLVGAIPERFRDVGGKDRLAGFDAARYFAMARGTADIAPLEMTKWFDTNYHYLVPEIAADAPFLLDASKPLAEFTEASERGLVARPVVVGPYTFLSLAKAAEGAEEDFDPLDRLADLVEVYVELLARLAEAGASWIQLDEPALVRDLTDEQLVLVEGAYGRLAAVEERPAILVSTYFADPVEALPTLVASGVEEAFDQTSVQRAHQLGIGFGQLGKRAVPEPHPRLLGVDRLGVEAPLGHQRHRRLQRIAGMVAGQGAAMVAAHLGSVLSRKARLGGQRQQHAGDRRVHRRLEAQAGGIGCQRVQVLRSADPAAGAGTDLEKAELAHALEVRPHRVWVQVEQLGDLDGGPWGRGAGQLEVDPVAGVVTQRLEHGQLVGLHDCSLHGPRQ